MKKQLLEDKKPLIVEFGGLPAAGKTTVITSLQEYFLKRGFRCEIVTTATNVSPISGYKMSAQFDVWSICRTAMCILEKNALKDLDIVFIERGLFDSICWLKYFLQKKESDFNSLHLDFIKNFALLDMFHQNKVLVIILMVDIETALLRRGKEGSIVNEEMYKGLGSKYADLSKELNSSNVFRDILFLSTDDLSKKQVGDLLISRIQSEI